MRRGGGAGKLRRVHVDRDSGAGKRRQRARDAAIYAKVRDLGGTRAILTFSGGNDEGGPDDIRLFDGEDAVKLDLDLDKPETWELFDQLGAPIYDEWGGFAGPFHVSGELRIDASAETMELVTLELVSEDEDLSEEFREMGIEHADRSGASGRPGFLRRLFGRR